MAFALKDIISIAREILKDEESEEYRYTDAQLLRAINVCVGEAYNIRPDAFRVVKDGLPYWTESDLDTEFPLPMNFFSPFCMFVAGFAELRNDEFTDDKRSRMLIGKFREDLQGNLNGAA